MELTTNQAVLDWCEQNGWKEPQFISNQWWAIAPNSFVPVPIPAEEIASIFDVDLAVRERARKAITLLEASPEEYQEARNRWNQFLEAETEKQQQQLRTAKQQSKLRSRNKSQFLQGVEKLLKQRRR